MYDFSAPLIAQSTPVFSTPPTPPLSTSPNSNTGLLASNNFTLTGVLLLTSIFMGWQWYRSRQKINQIQREQAKQREELEKTLLNLQEYLNSPDLKDSKILALDYLRMRLDEEVFHYQIIHQIQEQLANLISQLVNSTLPEDPPKTKQILLDRRIDIDYDLEGLEGKIYRCTVLRIHLQLRKLPLQSSSNTVKQIVEAVAVFLNHPQGQAEWKTSLQEQWLGLRWEPSNQPLPLLNLQNYPAKNKALPTASPPDQLPPISPVSNDFVKSRGSQRGNSVT